MEFIITFLLILFLIGSLLRRLFPMLLTWYVKRKMKNGGGSFGAFGPFAGGVFGSNPYNTAQSEQEQVRRSKAEEGKVTVEGGQEREKVIEKSMGEYIDFEEEKR